MSDDTSEWALIHEYAKAARKAKATRKAARLNTLCPLCQTVCVIRTNRSTQEKFWACPRYPDCKGTRAYGVPVGTPIE